MAHTHTHEQEIEGKLSPFLAQQRYKKVVAFIKPEDTVLDFGCGAGGFGKYVASKDATYYGTDTAKNWSDKSQNLFVQKVGEKLPKKLASVDFSVITALAVIEHLDKPVELFHSASQNLAKGGRFILTTPRPISRKVHDTGSKIGLFSSHASDEHEDFLDKKDLVELAKQSGFKLTGYKKFLLGMNQVAEFKKVK